MLVSCCPTRQPSSMHKVLAVTRRTPEMCATKAKLNAAGLDVVTVTNLALAKSLGQKMHFKAAIICLDSFTPQERDELATELKKSNPDLEVVVRCPGCTGCDEAAGKIGVLSDTVHIEQILAVASGK